MKRAEIGNGLTAVQYSDGITIFAGDNFEASITLNNDTSKALVAFLEECGMLRAGCASEEFVKRQVELLTKIHYNRLPEGLGASTRMEKAISDIQLTAKQHRRQKIDSVYVAVSNYLNETDQSYSQMTLNSRGTI